MKNILRALLVFACFLPQVALGQKSTGGTDYQFRLLFHAQRAEPNGLGIAGWGIVPDATNTENPRGLILGGLLYKQPTRWVELLGGTFLDGAGTDPVFDVRTVEKSTMFHWWGELMYTPSQDKFLVSPSITIPLIAKPWPIEGGAEADIVITKGVASYGVGPRLVAPLPIFPNVSFALAYQIKDAGPDILRSYLVWNF